jgi:dihydroorotase (multifunctional complex type)
MPALDLLLEGGTTVRPSGLRREDVGIREGRIEAFFEQGANPSARNRLNCGGKFILPGMIDPHIHMGRYGQDFAGDCRSESEAAVTGGVTTVLCYLIEQDPYSEILPQRIREIESLSLIDIGIQPVVMTEAQLADILVCAEKFDIPSFKFFMAYKGKDAGSLRGVDDGFLYRGLREVAKIPGAWVAIHPENMEVIETVREELEASGRTDGAAWSDSRPRLAEEDGIQRALLFSEHLGVSIVIPHLSIASGFPIIERHKKARQGHGGVVVETCGHYLALTKNSLEGARGKVNPPLREQKDVDGLWGHLTSGAIDFMGSDHCCFKLEVKGEEVWSARPGLPGVGMTVPIEGVAKGRLSLPRLAEVTSYNAAQTFGLFPRKGLLQIGADADLMVLDLEKEVRVTAGMLNSHADYSPYEGFVSRGWPVVTIAGGEIVQIDGVIQKTERRGKYLKRRPTGDFSRTYPD